MLLPGIQRLYWRLLNVDINRCDNAKILIVKSSDVCLKLDAWHYIAYDSPDLCRYNEHHQNMCERTPFKASHYQRYDEGYTEIESP